MNTIYCVTNTVLGPKHCHVNGEHKPTCTNNNCQGCWPRTAERGHVCQHCYQNIDHALAIADHLRDALAGIDRAITPESSNSIAGPRLPLSPVAIDLDAINRAQADHHDALTWVQTQDGATNAIRFTNHVRQAEHAHPTHEKPHPLNRFRCQKCSRLTVAWNPPQWPGDNVTIACIDPQCAWQATSEQAIDIIATIEAA